MTLTEFAEVAVPKPPTDRYQLRDVLCALCGFDQIMIEDDEIVCASCHSRICVLCGCVDEIACDDGCSWMLPGVCSTHDSDVRLAGLAIPGTPAASLALLN